MVQTQKQVALKLFFNRSTMTFYVQIGETLYAVRDTIAGQIQEREGLEIRHAEDMKSMQELSLSDDKK